MSTESPQQSRASDVSVVAAVVSALSILVALAGVGFGMRAVSKADENKTVAAAAVESPTVTLSEFKISPSAITAPVNGTITVVNKGTVQHNLHVDGQSNTTAMIDAGGSSTLSLAGLPAGTYKVICDVPGHASAGMTADLTIGASPSTAAAGGGPGSAGSTGGMAGMAGMAGMTGSSGGMSWQDMDKAMHDRTVAFPAKTEGLGGQDLAPKVLADGTKEFDLTAKIVKWEVEPGKMVDAWAYNGTVPGPTIKVNVGDKVRVVVKNELPESTAVHFHGIKVPNAMDGVPDITQPPVTPGSSFTYEFTAVEPAVGMYHSHHDAAKQVANGLAGAFLVGEMPVPAGAGPVTQSTNMMLNDSGTIGFSLNGKSFPATAPIVAKQGEWVEINYLNEGAQIHPMHLHGLDQLVIAKDGFPVPAPYKADTVMVAPGERYTVLVHATELGTWAFHCHILPHAEREDGMFGMVTAFIVK